MSHYPERRVRDTEWRKTVYVMAMEELRDGDNDYEGVADYLDGLADDPYMRNPAEIEQCKDAASLLRRRVGRWNARIGNEGLK